MPENAITELLDPSGFGSDPFTDVLRDGARKLPIRIGQAINSAMASASWLSGQWHLVDATGMGSADTMAVIAVGRDAYDVAFMDSQAPAEMVSQSINVSRA